MSGLCWVPGGMSTAGGHCFQQLFCSPFLPHLTEFFTSDAERLTNKIEIVNFPSVQPGNSDSSLDRKSRRKFKDTLPS